MAVKAQNIDLWFKMALYVFAQASTNYWQQRETDGLLSNDKGINILYTYNMYKGYIYFIY